MKNIRPNLKDLLNRGNLIQPDELAVGMGVARVTVRRGVIPCLKIEGTVRFDPEEIKVWLESKRQTASKIPGGARPGRPPDGISGSAS
jgi:hypothetical protein